MIYISFNSRSDIVSVILIYCAAKDIGVGTKVFFWINMDHSSTRRCCAGRFTHTFAMSFTGGFVIDIFDFGQTNLYVDKPFLRFDEPSYFMFHGKGIILWAARYSVSIDLQSGFVIPESELRGIYALENCLFSPKMLPVSNSLYS